MGLTRGRQAEAYYRAFGWASQAVAVGDFTGDGTSDILRQNPSNWDVDKWKISNGKWAGSIDLGSHPR